MVAALVERIPPLADLEAERARRRLIPFAQRMFPAYAPAQHHELIAHCLALVEEGVILRLILMLPPRHGKSELCSVHFPPWFLGRNPDKRVIACSYAAALAYRFSRQARNALVSPMWPFPEVRPAEDFAQVQSWDIDDHRGGYVSAGVGGAITGVGADLLLIDDPVKNAADALSETIRESVWDWYVSTAYTRLEPGGAVVVVGTRWHEDDLIGRLINQAGMGEEPWVVVTLPALSETSSVYADVTLPATLADRLGASEGDQFPSIGACFRPLGR